MTRPHPAHRRSVDLVTVTDDGYVSRHGLATGQRVRVLRPSRAVPGGVVVEAAADPLGFAVLCPGEWAPYRPDTVPAPPRVGPLRAPPPVG